MLLQVRLGMPLPNRVMRTNLLKNWNNNLPEYDHEELNLVVQTNVPLLSPRKGSERYNYEGNQ